MKTYSVKVLRSNKFSEIAEVIIKAKNKREALRNARLTALISSFVPSEIKFKLIEGTLLFGDPVASRYSIKETNKRIPKVKPLNKKQLLKIAVNESKRLRKIEIKIAKALK